MRKAKRAGVAALRQMARAPDETRPRKPREGCCDTPAGRKPASVRFVRTLNGVIAWAAHACGIEILEVSIFLKIGFKFGPRVAHGKAGGCKPLVSVAVPFRRRPGQRYYVVYTVADCCRHKKATFFYAI